MYLVIFHNWTQFYPLNSQSDPAKYIETATNTHSFKVIVVKSIRRDDRLHNFHKLYLILPCITHLRLKTLPSPSAKHFKTDPKLFDPNKPTNAVLVDKV